MLEPEILNFGASDAVLVAARRNLVSVAAFAGTVQKLGEALGGPLPAPGTWIERDGVVYLWTGPETWLAMSEDEGVEHRIAAAAKNLAAVTDQSDGKIIFLVAGPDPREILRKLLPIDLHETAFGRDATALTLAGHIPVQIWREDQKFALACFRSYGKSLYHALAEASAT
jgi:sarcosine oxidase subunit gamma